MNDRREIECARLAWLAKIDAAKQERLYGLTEIESAWLAEEDGAKKERSCKFKNPLAEMGFKQLLLLPIALIVVFFTVILKSIEYIWGCLESCQKAWELRKKINKGFDSTEFLSPKSKTLDALWRACDLFEELSAEHSVELLNKWLVVLYGQELAESVNVEARIDTIIQQQLKANLPFYEGSNAPHFHFASPTKVLIRELTEKLPPYGEKRC